MDWTALWFLLTVSIVGYLLIGLVVGSVVANLNYKDTESVSEARIFGGVSTVVWPLAFIVLVAAAIWCYGIAQILTPAEYRKKQEAAKKEREAKGLPAHGYVD